jgi:GntR family transcriptional regulator
VELVRLERLRLEEDEPQAIEESCLVHRMCPGLLRSNFTAESLREVLARENGVRWIRARQTVRAIPAPESTAGLLRIRLGAALLYIERLSYAHASSPVEFLRVQYRGDRYALCSEPVG